MKFRFIALLCAMLSAGGVTGPAQGAEAPWPKIDAGDWQYLNGDEEVRGYIKLVENEGHPRVWFRMEYRQPTVTEGLKTASSLILTEFNCDRRTSRDLSVTGYPRNNMKGKALTAYFGYEWTAVDAESVMTDLFAVACDNHVPRPPSVWTPMRVGQWEMLEDEDHIKIFISEASPVVYPRLWSRVELRDAADWNNRPYRSSQLLHEFDCAGGRARTVFNVRYPDHNLQGAPDMSAGYMPWTKTELGSAMHFMLRTACALEAASVEAARDKDGQLYETAAATRPLDRPYKYVKEDGWAAMALGSDYKTLVRGSNGGLYPRVEVRRELVRARDIGGGKARSVWTLTELDCLVGRHRPLKTIYYTKANLAGAESVVDRPGEWVAFDDGVQEYSMLKDACYLGLDEDGDPINPEGMTVPARESDKR